MNYEIFEFNGRTFSSESVPPIDDNHIQNALMIAPYNGEMYVYGWGCYNLTGDNDADVWEWEPLWPLNTDEGRAFLNQVRLLREALGL